MHRTASHARALLRSRRSPGRFREKDFPKLPILLILCLLCPSILAGPNLVRNPGFEEMDQKGDPAHWGCWGSNAGELGDAEVFWWEPEGYTGKRSVSLRQECWGMRGWWYTILRDIKPHHWYSVSVWAKRDRPTGWRPELNLFGQRMILNLYKQDVWRKFDRLFYSEEHRGDGVLKLINWRKPYKVWFDDVSVEEFSVELDPPAKPGMLSWQATETSWLVVFQVELSIDRQFEDAALIGETLKTELPFSSHLGTGKWYWQVKAVHNGVVLATSPPGVVNVQGNEAISRAVVPAADEVLPPHEPVSGKYVSFDKGLNTVVEGKPFFPIGVFSLPPEKFSEARRVGFNVAVTRKVEAARRAGLRAMVPRGFRYPPDGESEASLPLEEVDRWIIARFLWDEPAQKNVSPREVFAAHREEKKADAHHPTAVVIYRPDNFWPYASVSDILMTDPYPIPHRPMTVVSESVRTATEAVGDRKPVWAILQAFNWMEFSQEARRIGWARWPTYREMRCMVYLAAINGAKGVLFYRYPDEDKYGSLHWQRLKRMAGELRELSPILVGETVSVPVSVAVKTPSQPARKNSESEIEFTIKGVGHRTYLIAANNWPGTRQVDFSFESDLRGSATAPFEKRRIRAKPRSFSDLFEPYGVHVYELRFK